MAFIIIGEKTARAVATHPGRQLQAHRLPSAAPWGGKRKPTGFQMRAGVSYRKFQHWLLGFAAYNLVLLRVYR